METGKKYLISKKMVHGASTKQIKRTPTQKWVGAIFMSFGISFMLF